MRSQLFCLCWFLISSVAFAQSEALDEFEIQEPAVEINSSQEMFNTEQESATETTEKSELESPAAGITQEQPQEAETFDLTTTPEQKSSNEDDNTVMVRERVEEQQAPLNPSGFVEVRTSQDVFLPYKQRQSKWGFLFSVGAENSKFPSYITQVGPLTDTFDFKDLFGKYGVSMINFEMGPKYNTSLGSFALLLGYGSIDAKSSHVGSRTIFTMQKYSVSLAYYLDSIFPEPYVVPYVSGGIWQADVQETSAAYPDEIGKYSSKPGTQYRFGALFGLDWIEGDSARISRKQNGTQATFLNVYASTTIMSEKDPDPDLGSDMDLGASIIVEF